MLYSYNLVSYLIHSLNILFSHVQNIAIKGKIPMHKDYSWKIINSTVWKYTCNKMYDEQIFVFISEFICNIHVQCTELLKFTTHITEKAK